MAVKVLKLKAKKNLVFPRRGRTGSRYQIYIDAVKESYETVLDKEKAGLNLPMPETDEGEDRFDNVAKWRLSVSRTLHIALDDYLAERSVAMRIAVDLDGDVTARFWTVEEGEDAE